MYKLLIIDDEYLVREGLKKTIDWNSHGIELVGEATNGQEGYEMVTALTPDIILTDAKMPILNGLELAKKLHEEKYNGIVVVLSGYREFEYAKMAIDNDVFNYLLKPVSNEELVKTILEAIKRLEEKRNKEEILNLYEESYDEIKMKIIRDLIRADKPDTLLFKNRLETNKLPFFEEGVVIVVSMDEYDEEFHDELKTLNLILGESIVAGNFHYLSTIYHSRILIILNASEDEAFGIVKKSLDKYEEEIDDVTFSAGISNHFLSLKSINKEYEIAKNLADSELLLSINSILDAKNSNGRYSKNTGRALQVIFNEFDQPLTVKYVSERIGVSESYLAHQLKDDLGKTFNTILTGCRIAHAKKLLKEKRYRVNEVAYKVGYNDERYFAAVFKKHAGFTPSRYAEEE